MQALQVIRMDLVVPLQPEDRRTGHQDDLLGYSIKQTLGAPPVKAFTLGAVILSWLFKRTCTLEKLQSLLLSLNWAAECILAARISTCVIEMTLSENA